MNRLSDTFALAPDAQNIVTQLVSDKDEFAHLSQARIACVASQVAPMLHGWPCQAFVAQPRVQGPFKWFFDWALANFCKAIFDTEDPDFVIMIDAAIWSSMDAEHKEHLMYHELSHLIAREDEYGVPKRGDDGRIKLTVRPHDYEFFDSEVRAYGPEVVGVDEAAVALADGYRSAKGRSRVRKHGGLRAV